MGNEVRLITRPPEYEESTIVATCFNESWAEVIAGLLQADWEADTPPVPRPVPQTEVSPW